MVIPSLSEMEGVSVFLAFCRAQPGTQSETLLDMRIQPEIFHEYADRWCCFAELYPLAWQVRARGIMRVDEVYSEVGDYATDGELETVPCSGAGLGLICRPDDPKSALSNTEQLYHQHEHQ